MQKYRVHSLFLLRKSNKRLKSQEKACVLCLCWLRAPWVLPWDTVDNSASPCEGISGWFSPDLTGRIPQPVGRLAPPQPSSTPNQPLFFSSSIISLHFCSKFEARRKEYWVTEYFSRGPSAVRFPCCHG